MSEGAFARELSVLYSIQSTGFNVIKGSSPNLGHIRCCHHSESRMKQLRWGQGISSAPGLAPGASASVLCLGHSLAAFGLRLLAWLSDHYACCTLSNPPDVHEPCRSLFIPLPAWSLSAHLLFPPLLSYSGLSCGTCPLLPRSCATSSPDMSHHT